MVPLIQQHGKTLFCSFDIYKAVGYSPASYSRWLKREIINNATKGVDYFDYEQETTQKRRPGYQGKKYLVTPNFAISICLMSKTEIAKKIKLWIQLNDSILKT
jgi:phage anti-repressor protein